MKPPKTQQINFLNLCFPSNSKPAIKFYRFYFLSLINESFSFIQFHTHRNHSSYQVSTNLSKCQLDKKFHLQYANWPYRHVHGAKKIIHEYVLENYGDKASTKRGNSSQWKILNKFHIFFTTHQTSGELKFYNPHGRRKKLNLHLRQRQKKSFSVFRREKIHCCLENTHKKVMSAY